MEFIIKAAELVIKAREILRWSYGLWILYKFLTIRIKVIVAVLAGKVGC